MANNLLKVFLIVILMVFLCVQMVNLTHLASTIIKVLCLLDLRHLFYWLSSLSTVGVFSKFFNQIVVVIYQDSHWH